MSEYSIHREVQHLTERLYKLERDTRSVLEEKDKRTAELEAALKEARAPYVVEQNDRMFLLGGVVWYSETCYKQSKAVAHSQGYAQGLEDAAKRLNLFSDGYAKQHIDAIRALQKPSE